MTIRVRTRVALMVLLAVVLAGCAWPSYMNGMIGSGFNLGETKISAANAATLVRKWTASSGGPVFAQPVVANETVYWGSFDGFERATDLQGNLRWARFIGTTTPPPGACYPPSLGVVSTAMYRSDVTVGASHSVLFVGGGDARFYALDAQSGVMLWTRSLGASPSNFIFGSPSYYSGSIYIGISSFGDCPLVQGRLFRIDATTGAIQNTLDLAPAGCTGVGLWGSPTSEYAPGGAIYFVTGNSGSCSQSEPLGESLVKASLADLHVIDHWTVPPNERVPDSDFGSTPNLFTATINGTSRLLVGAVNKNGIYYAFDRNAIAAGPVWQRRIATGGAAPDYGQGTLTPGAWDPISRRLYLGSDAVTIGSTNCRGSISAVDPNAGTFVWRDCLADGFVIGAVSGAPGIVIVGEGTHLLIVRTSDGHILFNYTGSATFQGPASIADGVVYATDTDGTLSAFAPP
jgi:outer membrane protein assembly factor BamB